MSNSNTTLVKVKYKIGIYLKNIINDSNTTLVKVKLTGISAAYINPNNSNTTLVKVKSKAIYIFFNFIKFKYNSC